MARKLHVIRVHSCEIVTKLRSGLRHLSRTGERNFEGYYGRSRVASFVDNRFIWRFVEILDTKESDTFDSFA